MKTDREEHAFRAVYDQLVDPAPSAPPWEELMDTATRKKELPAHRTPTSRRPILIAAASALLVALFIGGFALFGPLGGTEDGELIDERPVTTTTPGTATTAAPKETSLPTTAAAVPPLEWETVIEPPMHFPSVGVGAEGYPMIVGRYGIDQETGLGTVGLIRCLDPDCVEDPEVVDLVREAPHQGMGLVLQFGKGPDALPILGVEKEWDPTQDYVDPFNGLEYHARPSIEVLYCRNAECSNVDPYQIGSMTAYEALVTGGWTFGNHGLPMFSYLKGEPNVRELHLVACSDPGCQKVASDIVVDAKPAAQGSVFVQGEAVPAPEVQLVYTVATPISPPGREGGWDEATYYEEVRVATCADTLCTDGATIRTIGPGWLARTFEGLDGLPRLVVRTDYVETWSGTPPVVSDPGDVQLTHELVTCLDPSCDRIERRSLGTTDLSGPITGFGGWDFGPDGAPLGVATVEVFEEAVVPGENGLEEGYVTVGSRLVYSRCDDPACSSWTATELKRWTEEDDPEGWYLWGEGAGVTINPDGLPLVFYDGPDGVHVLHCPDVACTPPSD